MSHVPRRWGLSAFFDHFGFVYRSEDIPGIKAAFAVSDDGAIEGPDNLRVELYAIAED